MEDMEDKIGAILSNPQMMQQIMAMAQSLGGASGPPGEQSQPLRFHTGSCYAG